MRSGLSAFNKKVKQNAAPPVPLSAPQRASMFDLGTGRASKESQLRAYGMSGTVFSIVSLLQSAPAGGKWHLYQKNTDPDQANRLNSGSDEPDQRTEVFTHPALSLWNSPNAFHSGFEFREGSNQHFELCGETFWVLDNETFGFPTSMWYIRPDRMEPIPGVDTFLAGWIYHSPGGELVPLDVGQVILEKSPDPLDPFRGAGPVGSIMANIEQQDYATRYQRNLFLNGADPGAIIQLPNKLTDREWNEFVSRWRESHQGVARAGRVGILENGAQWVAPAGLNNKDMEYATLRQANRDEIREAWRMHKTMLGTADDVNRANAETAEEVFTSWMTIPRLDRRKDTLNCKLLPLYGTSGQNVEFDYDDPTPPDPTQAAAELTAKATAAAALIDAGLDQSDVLAAVGLPDMAIAEKPTQMPVAPPGWVPAPPAAPSGPAPSSSDGSDDSEAALTALLRASLNGHNGNGHHLNGAR